MFTPASGAQTPVHLGLYCEFASTTARGAQCAGGIAQDFPAPTLDPQLLDSLKLELESEAGSAVQLKVRRNMPRLTVRAEGAELIAGEGGQDALAVKFPPGSGYQQQTVTLHW